MKKYYKKYPFATFELALNNNNKIIGFTRIYESKEDNFFESHTAKYIYEQLDEYFNGTRTQFDVELEISGSQFQKLVWEKLQNIPYGETQTYKQVSKLVGNEKAARAVGLANSKNPIIIFIPCHRVIGTSGKLVGYSDGLDLKEYLLTLEKSKP